MKSKAINKKHTESKEQFYQMLLKWKETKGEEATKGGVDWSS